MHLLLTRPESDADPMRKRLEAAGHRVSLCPLLTIELAPNAAARLDGVQALVATSRNGLDALAKGPGLAAAIKLPVFVVGPATAERARALGFTDVREGPGSAAELAPAIAKALKPEKGDVLHLSGASIAFDLAAALKPQGITVRRQVVYWTREAEALEPASAAYLRRGQVGGVILMSPRTAAVFADVTVKAGVAEPARHTTCFCLSPAVAAALEPLAPYDVRVAERPNAEEMLALIARVAPESP